MDLQLTARFSHLLGTTEVLRAEAAWQKKKMIFRRSHLGGDYTLWTEMLMKVILGTCRWRGFVQRCFVHSRLLVGTA